MNRENATEAGYQGLNDCQKVVVKWCALLDGELEETEARGLWEHVRMCPECEPYVGNLKQFNQVIQNTLDHDATSDMPDQLRANLQALLRQEDLGEQGSGSITSLDKHRGLGRYYRLFPVGIAASIAAILLLTVVFLAENEAENVAPQDYVEIINDLVALRDNMVMSPGGSHRSEIEAYAMKVGYSATLPESISPLAGWPEMKPICVCVGEIRGRRYQAVCFCSGPLDPDGDDPMHGSMRRFVLFTIDGNIIPKDMYRDKNGLVIRQLATYTVAAWNTGPDNSLTCIAITMAEADASEARALAETLVSVN